MTDAGVRRERRGSVRVATVVVVAVARIAASLALLLYSLGVPLLCLFLAAVGSAMAGIDGEPLSNDARRTFILVGLVAVLALPVAIVPAIESPPPTRVRGALAALSTIALVGSAWVWLVNPLDGRYVPWVAAAGCAGAVVAVAWLAGPLRPRTR